MKLQSPKLWLPFLFALVLSGCATAVVNYRPVAVPEEGALIFTRITVNADRVHGPSTLVTAKGTISTTDNSWFDLSRNGEKIAFVGSPGMKPGIGVKDLTRDEPTNVRNFKTFITDVAFASGSKAIALSLVSDLVCEIGFVDVDTGASVRKIIGRFDFHTPDFLQTDKMSEPAFSPDGRALVFVVSKPLKLDKRIVKADYLVKYDRLTHDLRGLCYGTSPCFGPSNYRIVFMRPNYETDLADLWSFDLITFTQKLIASSGDFGFREPAISPDGKQIAFVARSAPSNVRPNLDIAVMNIDGTHTRRLTFHPGHDVRPRWSPDGKAIYFLSQRGSDKGQWNIWRMDLPQ